MSYCALAMVTDYDCWRDGEDAVDAESVMTTMKKNVDRARALIVKSVEAMEAEDWSEVIENNEVSQSFEARVWPSVPQLVWNCCDFGP